MVACSVNPKSKVGFGAYLKISELQFIEKSKSLTAFKNQIQLKQFTDTSSTLLELQTLLWAVNEIECAKNKITIYTDCQNILGLENRRSKFEENNYRTKKNKKINHYKLYQHFFIMADKLDIKVIKIKGHQSSAQKNQIDKIFSLVDKASRSALRNLQTQTCE